MAPTEAEVLSNYLIQPSGLTSIITFEQFQALFPPSLHESPQLRSLFRDLRAQRETVLHSVTESIDEESRRGAAMRREVVRARREAAAEELDGEVEMERALFGNESGAKKANHTLASIVPELDGAISALEFEIDKLIHEEEALTESIKQTVGSLSDLRYGKLSNAQLRDEVVDGLATLQETCKGKT